MVGGLAGYWIGQRAGYPVAFGAAAASSAVLLLSVSDTLHGHALLDWLRNPEAGRPKLPGIWGELSHRVERLLRQRDADIAHERGELQQFLSAIEASPNGVMLLDENDQLTWISPAAADHFGLNRHRDLQQRVTNLVRQPAFVQYLQAGDFNEAVKCPLSRGGMSWLLIQVREFGEGRKLILSQDITERERSDTMRRDFVANVSHEIRTPLTVLMGFIETLGALPLTEVERKRVIALMAEQADRMQCLVSDLLTLAQIEGSPRPASDRWLPLSQLLQRIINDARGLSLDRHPVTMTPDPELISAEISGVESEWLSAMGNLVSNAIRYTPAGQSIDIEWRFLTDGGAEFSVRDHGIGIAAEHLPRLTERFYRVDGSRSRDTGGTGLGLSIVKHVIQRHGGELKVSSELGKGSVFTLHIPAMRIRQTGGAAPR
jgi:two-component system phosphate regulon sensor histidine kinase PhoR